VYAAPDPQVESPRPYLHPVRTLRGDVVTAYRPHDHVWHKGIAWSLPVVGDDNFWGGPSYVHGRGYVALANNGTMAHTGFATLSCRPERVDIVHDLEWLAEGGARRILERRSLGVRLTGDAWALTVGTAMTNVGHEPIALGSPTTRGRPAAGYGGLFWRGPRSFTGGRAFAGDASAPSGDDLMGTRHEWVAFTGRHDEVDRSSTLVFVDAPDNPGHPTKWFVRSTEFPGVCPAPFYDAEVAIEPGETLRLRYAVTVADGARTPEECAGLAAAGLDALAAATRGPAARASPARSGSPCSGSMTRPGRTGCAAAPRTCTPSAPRATWCCAAAGRYRR
jgi:hypothetical protein